MSPSDYRNVQLGPIDWDRFADLYEKYEKTKSLLIKRLHELWAEEADTATGDLGTEYDLVYEALADLGMNYEHINAAQRRGY